MMSWYTLIYRDQPPPQTGLMLLLYFTIILHIILDYIKYNNVILNIKGYFQDNPSPFYYTMNIIILTKYKIYDKMLKRGG